MKKIILTSLASILTLCISAQSKIDGAAHIAIEKYRSQRSALSIENTSETPKVKVIVSTNHGFTPSDIAELGYNIEQITDWHGIVELGIDEIETLAMEPCVRSISWPRTRRKSMLHARQTSAVDDIHTGIKVGDATHQLTGKGVIVGLYDAGVDPNHPNFKNTDGTSRVKRLYNYTSSSSYKEYTDDTVGTFTTDDSDETHGTHVAGIMGGGYRGASEYIDENGTLQNGSHPFYGVAYESDLAFGCGSFSDDAILGGVTRIVEYAEAQGQPAVINLSLGSNDGPHDGTDNFTAALDELGRRAIICVASGNEGDTNLSIEKTFTSTDTQIKTLLYYNSSYYSNNEGYLDIWSDDATKFTVQVANVNSSGTLSNTVTVGQNANGTSLTTCVKTAGTLYAYAGTDANSGRYYCTLEFTGTMPKSGRFAIIVTGSDGQRINMYFSGSSEFTDKYSPTYSSMSGFTAGTPGQSINGMCCGDGTVAVGSYTSRDSWWDFLQEDEWTYGETAGTVTSFSSYGTDFFGNTLPHILAPGSIIISSYSRRYVAKGYEYETSDDMVARTNYDGNTEYWGPMQGTSMATPYVTGTIGLWLEADPSLTRDDVLDVMAYTATPIDESRAADTDKVLYGKLDAAEGLRYILSRAGVGTIMDDDHRIIVTTEGNILCITAAGEANLSVDLYNLAGQTVAKTTSQTATATINTSGLPHGIYLLKVKGALGTATKKIAL